MENKKCCEKCLSYTPKERSLCIDPDCPCHQLTSQPLPSGVKITCLGIDCPERKSICCGVISRAASEIERMLGVPQFFCHKCGKEYQGGECTAQPPTIQAKEWEEMREDLREEFDELFPKDQEAIDGKRPSLSHRSEALVLWAKWEVIFRFYRQSLVEGIKGMKKELGGSPLGTSGLSIGETIVQDIEFRKKGYINKWDANRDLNEVLDKVLNLIKEIK